MSGNPFAADRLTVSVVYKGINGKKIGSRSEKKEIHGVSLVVHEDAKAHGDAGHGDGTWIYSFADLIMNLLMFFVMMFAISSIDKNKFSQVQEAFSSLSKNAGASKAAVAKQPSGEGPGSGKGFSPYSGETRFTNQMSNTEILERVKDLLAKVDPKTLQLSQKQDKGMAEIKPQVEKLTKAVAAELSENPMRESFDVVVPVKSLFVNEQISENGKSILNRLAQELKPVRERLFVNVVSYLPTDQKNIDTMGISATRASRVMSALAMPLELDETRASAAGFATRVTDGLSKPERIVIRLAVAPKKEARK